MSATVLLIILVCAVLAHFAQEKKRSSSLARQIKLAVSALESQAKEIEPPDPLLDPDISSSSESECEIDGVTVETFENGSTTTYTTIYTNTNTSQLIESGEQTEVEVAAVQQVALAVLAH